MHEQELFEAACEILDPKQRRAFVAQACGSDKALRCRLEALLAAHENADGFLDTPAIEQMSDPMAISTVFVTTEVDDNSHKVVPSPDDQTRTTDHNLDQNSDGNGVDHEREIRLDFLSPPTRSDSLGRLEKYEILDVIGRGAFGIVLKALDEKLQRVVAIKVLSPELAATSSARKRFLREARVFASVRHEHVVHIYAVDDQPFPYLVMEYTAGQTIQQRIDERGPLAVTDVLRYGHQIASGLAAAHAIGLIHRDIKPANILLETVGDRVKITDFGLARAADDASVTQSGVIAGTPLYMAPEQALGEPIDARADLFSLGSVMYVMLSGRPPFRAPSTVAVLKRVTDDTPRPIQEIMPHVPDWLCKIVSKLHAKRPEDRFASAEEVADLLKICLSQLQSGAVPVLSHLSERRSEGKSSLGKHRWAAIASGFLLLLLITVGMVYRPRQVLDRFHTSMVSKDSVESLVESVATAVPSAPSVVSNGAIALGPLLNPGAMGDGSFDDVSFDGDILHLDGTKGIKHLWINFFGVQGRNLTIRTQLRVINPKENGFAKLVVKSDRLPELDAILDNEHQRSGDFRARIKIWSGHNQSTEKGAMLPVADATEWIDLKFVVEENMLSFYVGEKQTIQMPRTNVVPGAVALGCGGWLCEMRQPSVTIHRTNQNSAAP